MTREDFVNDVLVILHYAEAELNLDFFVKELTEVLQKYEKELNVTKGQEYTGADEDALLNFKEAARFLGLTPLQVCGVYMYKHLAAIMSYAKNGCAFSDESLQGRIADLRLYAALFLALVKEEEDESSDDQV